MKTANQKQTIKENDDKEYAELVVLKPVGYPFELTRKNNKIARRFKNSSIYKAAI